MQALPQDGEMVAVFNEAQVTTAIQPYVQEVGIAAINGSHIVISGKGQAVQGAIAVLRG